MLKDYPATQLFLISSLILLVLLLIAPLTKDWNALAAVLGSLKFIVKVICGFFFFFMIIDIIDGLRLRKPKH